MSRIGDVPIEIPENVEVNLNNDNTITVKGPEGELTKTYHSRCDINMDEEQIVVERKSDSKQDKALHGLVRSLIVNMIEGVVDLFEKKLEMIGVGYGAQVQGGNLELEVGYSHPVVIEAPEDIEFEVESGSRDIQALIIIKGMDKQKVGEIAAEIREVRKPEPYKGKGIRYQGENVRRKVGKTG